MKCLRLKILPETGDYRSSNSSGHQRRVGLLLVIVFVQPAFIWYLTQHLIVS